LTIAAGVLAMTTPGLSVGLLWDGSGGSGTAREAGENR
jgi:hypothetical protein